MAIVGHVSIECDEFHLFKREFVSNTTEERELKRKARTYSKNYSVAESTANDIKEENDGNDDEQNKRKRGKNQVKEGL